MKMRALIPRIHEASHETAAVRDSQLHPRGRSALVMPSRIIAVPRENARNRSVHACSHHKGHAVLDFGIGTSGYYAIAYDCDGETKKHYGPAHTEFVGDDGDYYGGYGGYSVWNYGP